MLTPDVNRPSFQSRAPLICVLIQIYTNETEGGGGLHLAQDRCWGQGGEGPGKPREGKLSGHIREGAGQADQEAGGREEGSGDRVC